MWISYGTLNPVWYCPVVMGKKKTHRNGQKTTGMGKKPTGILCGISYGTLIAVWYCPVVMGKKHRNMLWYFLWTVCGISCGFAVWFFHKIPPME